MGISSEFLYPAGRYRGPKRPEYLAFNDRLQEFGRRVSYVCALETGGKLPPEEAFEQLEQLWTQLEQANDQFRASSILSRSDEM
ncbi:MAG TPA: hypothetical protein V6C78_28870 [Crinalium sp.]|jgi:hypothetical protein